MASLVRMTFDLNGNLVQLVVPDNDSELSDPAFSPPGLVSVNLLRSSYDACRTSLAVLQAVKPAVTLAHAGVGAKLQAIIAAHSGVL